MDNKELKHYGVPGMKWGHRKAQGAQSSKLSGYSTRITRGHAGPGVYFGRNRQLDGDKRDLEILNKGGHLSVGLGKKRQAAYDARDRAIIEQRIAKNEAYFKKHPNKRKATSITKSVSKGRKIATSASILMSTLSAATIVATAAMRNPKVRSAVDGLMSRKI